MAKMMMMKSAMKASMKMKKSMKAMVMKKGELLIINVIKTCSTPAITKKNFINSLNCIIHFST